MFMYDMM